MNKSEIADKFTKIIARHLDIKDQLSEGVDSARLDHERWIVRYRGSMPTDGTLVFNTFHPEVAQVIAQLMIALDDT